MDSVGLGFSTVTLVSVVKDIDEAFLGNGGSKYLQDGELDIRSDENGVNRLSGAFQS